MGFLARVLGLAAISLLVMTMGASAAPRSDCATIQGGTIKDSAGNTVVLGYDEFGYNYQAHMFSGTYDSSDRVVDGLYWGIPGSADYADDSLIMKWSDAWLANVDCDGDGKLDRGLVDGDVGGVSKGWLTNQVQGDYTDATGVHHYTSFVKIVWVGTGGSLWGGAYEIVQEVYNDPSAGTTGLQLKLGSPGFGLNDRWTTNN